ncbi:STAS domain-containing protein [Streptomyces sp. NPDC058195]|uniref:STAS domain-containing protein n=1 Tax=Streptomyces sp. NPDC058195 TaxID=3346375 RepID=UPI0036EC7308
MSPNVLVVTGRVTRTAVPGLCAELESLLYGPDGAVRDPDAEAEVDCDVGGVARVDLVLVEAVARLGLVARRAGGRRLRLRNAPPELRGLLDLVGLADVVDVRYAPEPHDTGTNTPGPNVPEAGGAEPGAPEPDVPEAGGAEPDVPEAGGAEPDVPEPDGAGED